MKFPSSFFRKRNGTGKHQYHSLSSSTNAPKMNKEIQRSDLWNNAAKKKAAVPDQVTGAARFELKPTKREAGQGRQQELIIWSLLAHSLWYPQCQWPPFPEKELPCHLKASKGKAQKLTTLLYRDDVWPHTTQPTATSRQQEEGGEGPSEVRWWKSEWWVWEANGGAKEKRVKQVEGEGTPSFPSWLPAKLIINWSMMRDGTDVRTERSCSKHALTE